jgi:hypothetical protein
MTVSTRQVISASRRTDLVGWYPDVLADILESTGLERIHTLVIWTKHPANMLTHPRLRVILSSLRQIYLHLTVTGMGAGMFEPDVPHADEILPLLPEIIELCRDPRRIAWRFDPIFTWRDSSGVHDNVGCFDVLAPEFAGLGIKRVITSICSLYPKVRRRFQLMGEIEPVEVTGSERIRLRNELRMKAEALGLELKWCCEEGEDSAGCIDGVLLTSLHPDGEPAPARKATGQRKTCGCTVSRDIGWYSQVCRSGCASCYASPVIRLEKTY